MQTQRFRKKPVEVEAFQVTKEWLDSFRDPSRFEAQVDKEGAVSLLHEYVDRESVKGMELWIQEDSIRLHIPTLEGLMEAKVGDWIITGVKGEKYPCKPDIFAATYEPI